MFEFTSTLDTAFWRHKNVQIGYAIKMFAIVPPSYYEGRGLTGLISSSTCFIFSSLSQFSKKRAQPKKMYAYCMMRNARVSLLVVITKCIFVTFALACIIAMAYLRLKRNRSIPLDQVSCSLESLPWEFRELNIIKVFYPLQGFVKRVE